MNINLRQVMLATSLVLWIVCIYITTKIPTVTLPQYIWSLLLINTLAAVALWRPYRCSPYRCSHRVSRLDCYVWDNKFTRRLMIAIVGKEQAERDYLEYLTAYGKLEASKRSK